MTGSNLMKEMRSWFPGGRRAGRTRSVPPLVEELEPRQALSRAAVASGIIRSTEHFVDFVVGEYARFLRRTPDVFGLNSFVLQLEQGRGPASVEAAFVSGPEYILNHGNTPVGFLTGLYEDLLGRIPSLAEVNFWLNQLGAGSTPFQVALGFTTSTEREAIIISEDYFTFLGRAPEPGAVNFWLSRFQQGFNREDVASAIVSSTEFFLQRGSNPVDFIGVVYLDVLQRTPSLGEVDFWLRILALP